MLLALGVEPQAERLEGGVRAVSDEVGAIATELSMCVSLLRAGELDVERLVAVRDMARDAAKRAAAMETKIKRLAEDGDEAAYNGDVKFLSRLPGYIFEALK